MIANKFQLIRTNQATPEAAQRGPACGDTASAEGVPSSSPRPVTRGESTTPNNVKIDWINCTFPTPSMSPAGFVALLGRLFGRPVSAADDRGMLGFEKSVKLFAHHGSVVSPVGCLAFGGESQMGRWLFQLTGSGCDFVKDWDGLADLLESLGGKLTRVDLAMDFLDGQHTVDDALALYQAGAFTSGGRAPSSEVAGDWVDGTRGRTLYIGKGKNGKMLRVYEKGRQLGDFESDWTRFEVQLGSRDRVIPFDCLTDRNAFFAGCYPALASMIEDAARAIPTLVKGGEVTLAHLVSHLKRCYGKVVHVLSGPLAAIDAELIEEVRIVGTPRRLNASSVAAGLTWEQVISQTRKFQQ